MDVSMSRRNEAGTWEVHKGHNTVVLRLGHDVTVTMYLGEAMDLHEKLGEVLKPRED